MGPGSPLGSRRFAGARAGCERCPRRVRSARAAHLASRRRRRHRRRGRQRCGQDSLSRLHRGALRLAPQPAHGALGDPASAVEHDDEAKWLAVLELGDVELRRRRSGGTGHREPPGSSCGRLGRAGSRNVRRPRRTSPVDWSPTEPVPRVPDSCRQDGSAAAIGIDTPPTRTVLLLMLMGAPAAAGGRAPPRTPRAPRSLPRRSAR
jgi:hypothetical protein